MNALQMFNVNQDRRNHKFQAYVNPIRPIVKLCRNTLNVKNPNKLYVASRSCMGNYNKTRKREVGSPCKILSNYVHENKFDVNGMKPNLIYCCRIINLHKIRWRNFTSFLSSRQLKVQEMAGVDNRGKYHRLKYEQALGFNETRDFQGKSTEF